MILLLAGLLVALWVLSSFFLSLRVGSGLRRCSVTLAQQLQRDGRASLEVEGGGDVRWVES